MTPSDEMDSDAELFADAVISHCVTALFAMVCGLVIGFAARWILVG